jgi:2-polyprenyl-3-methyl-5-hydroxy-6-metoxy-1,4-benzoquinol methylase
MTPHIIKEILKVAKGPRILDIGCGDGTITSALSDRFKEVVGLDGSAQKLQRAKQAAPRAKFIHSTIEDFRPSAYDPTALLFNTVLLVGVLEHLASPINMLSGVKSFLAKNGVIVIVTPNAESVNRRVGKILGMISGHTQLTEADLAIGHKRLYTKKLLEDHIRKSDLRIESMRGMFLKPLSNAQMKSWSPELLDAFYEVGKQCPTELCALLLCVCSTN